MATARSALISPRNRFRWMIAAAALALATPLILAQSNTPPPTAPSGKPLAFTIVSIKPHGNAPEGNEGCNVDACRFVDRPLRAFLMVAFGLSDKHLLGGPSWSYEDRFDLDAKIDPSDVPSMPLSARELAEMLQPVLGDRFQLRAHHETRTFPVYNIVLAKGGLKMKESAPPAPAASANPASPADMATRSCYPTSLGNGLRVERNCTIQDIARILEGPSGRSLVDKTGSTGRYDFELRWTPDNTPADSSLAGDPSIFTAVQEQLGLKLEPSTAPLDVLVIDSAEKPAAN